MGRALQQSSLEEGPLVGSDELPEEKIVRRDEIKGRDRGTHSNWEDIVVDGGMDLHVGDVQCENVVFQLTQFDHVQTCE